MKKSEQYLERKPVRCPQISWKSCDGAVTLEIENKGIMNRIFQLFFNKPKNSYIYLDDMGSFLWEIMDGNKDVSSLGVAVLDRFGEKSLPLYERLSKYLEILESYGFITWNK